MKVLIVCSGNAPNFDFKINQSFIYEQIESVKSLYNIHYDTFFISGKGVKGYLFNLSKFRAVIAKKNYSLIHAHNLPSGILSRLQFKVPLIVTFHGSDINLKYHRKFSRLLSRITSHNIVVSKRLFNLLNNPNKTTVIPCGIDTNLFHSVDVIQARKSIKLDNNKKIILFASAFGNKIKNFALAENAVRHLNGFEEIQILELKGKTREEVNLLMNAADMLLLTSFSEGSPQVIKEAMACNCPIVATDVGDIKEVIGNTAGCFITSFDPVDIANKIKLAIKFGKRTNGREKVKHLDDKLIAKKIFDIYKEVLEIK